MTILTRKYTLIPAVVLSGLWLTGCAVENNTSVPTDISDAPETKETATMTSATDDPFLWLEEVEGEEAIAWVKSQNERTLAELESDARYEPLLADAKAILNSDERIAGAALRDGYAYNFWQDETNTRGLWRRMAIAEYIAGGSNWDILLDFDKLAETEDENWVYKGSDCLAPTYTRCILTLSRGGSDASVRREFDVVSKSFVEGGFELEEAKAGTAWVDQDAMLVGMDLGEGTMTTSGYPRTTRLWKRGQSIADAEIVFDGKPEDVGTFPFTQITEDRTFQGIIRSITFFERETFLKNSTGDFEQLPLPRKSSVQGVTLGLLVISLQEDWAYQGSTYKTGSIVTLDPDSKAAALVYEPGPRAAVESIFAAQSVIYAELLDNIVGKVVKFTPSAAGWDREQIELPDAGVVSISSVEEKTGDMLVYFENPTTPETQYYVQNEGLQAQSLKSTPVFFDTEDIVTTQYEARSTDGTKIPYFVTAKESVLATGPAPTIQYGYGGFQISILPTYSGTTGKMWLARGGVYVNANIRGGGEFGPEWHQAVLKENRQLAFDDFFAVSEDLIARGITTPSQLGILGGSNGGLLMGVSMIQRPDLYNAIGIGVPLLDMLRYHKLLAGASWVGEYGDPDIEEERIFIEKYSPYQNLDEGMEYPRVYFFTSTKDDRVHPGHARKMAAKMASYDMPFLYYENIEGGHAASANRDQTAKRLALQYVYFLRQLADNGIQN